MGKKLKNIIIYGVIIAFCGIALAGYLIQNRAAEAKSAQTPEAMAGTAPAAAAGEGAPMLADGNNINGRSVEENQTHIAKLMKDAVAEPDPSPVVGIGRGEDYAEVTAKAIENAGGIEGLVKEGDVVLIKPNICTEYMLPGSPFITDYRTVQKVIDMVREFGASRVIVAEGSFYGNVFNYEGNKYRSLKGAELFNFNDCEEKDCYELKPGKSAAGKALFIPKIYMDADVVINIAKLKTHNVTTVSLSLKNCIGIPSAKVYGNSSFKAGLHGLGIENAIVDLNRMRRPELSIIEGIVGGEGYGPTDNTPVKSNIIFAGKDRVALDTVACAFMGVDAKSVLHLKQAEKSGLGIGDLKKIKVVGEDLDSIKMKFFNPLAP